MADQNKTEKATPRRRQKAREQGQVPRSRDLVAAIGTIASVMLLSWQLPGFAASWRGLLRHELDSAAMRPDQLLPAWRGDLAIFRGLAIAASLSWLLATLAGVAQGGLVFAPSALAPSLNRINPASRLEQLFSLNAVSRLLKSMLPTAGVVYLTFAAIARDWERFLPCCTATAAGCFRSPANECLRWHGNHLSSYWPGLRRTISWNVGDTKTN